MKDLLSAGAHCRRNLEHGNFASSSLADCVMKFFQKACRTFIFPLSTNQIIEISSAVSLRCRQIMKWGKIWISLCFVLPWQKINLLKGRVTRVGDAGVAALALLESSLRFKHSYTKHIFDAKDLFRALNGRPRCQIKFKKYFPFGMFTGNLYKFEASQS